MQFHHVKDGMDGLVGRGASLSNVRQEQGAGCNQGKPASSLQGRPARPEWLVGVVEVEGRE